MSPWLTPSQLNRSIGLAMSAVRYALKHSLDCFYRRAALACLLKCKAALRKGNIESAQLFFRAGHGYLIIHRSAMRRAAI